MTLKHSCQSPQKEQIQSKTKPVNALKHVVWNVRQLVWWPTWVCLRKVAHLCLCWWLILWCTHARTASKANTLLANANHIGSHVVLRYLMGQLPLFVCIFVVFLQFIRLQSSVSQCGLYLSIFYNVSNTPNQWSSSNSRDPSWNALSGMLI